MTYGANIFMSLHERFKAERERLGLTQPQIAVLTSVGKTTVINWEKGASSPTAVQLEVLAKLGMDALYVVTGNYAGGVPPAPSLKDDERLLLDYYREAQPAVRKAAMAALLSGQAGGMGASMNMSNLGDGNVQIGSIGGSYSAVPPKPSLRKKTK
ncbi:MULTISPECIES: helix-turn-helix transcriptional regulator [Comamonas]|uniref:helix-turn-helix domain-containing protein n=1 Tax=Comamonas TaxID=283 RepID=UPI0001DA67EE|nr:MULTISPECIES: helix-turn-helix transcriptional regulator [Comamonas]EFI60728.1 transcriptional regulator, XRE family protein [Comamonas thiooxydans]TFF63095.1 XRE family transcriptional regulator [Comamonas sp. A23]